MLQALGRLHPLVVHFPIALLLVALGIECLRPRRAGLSEAGLVCLAFGTLGAVAAALTGWIFAEHDPPGMTAVLLRHRWSGVGTAAAAAATLVSAWRWRRTGSTALARPTRVGLVLTAVCAALSAHLGGTLVYGEGFVLDALREQGESPAPVTPLSAAALEVQVPPESAGEAPETASGSPATVRDPAAAPHSSAPAPVDYASEIRPLLERRCYECHGPRKRPKGHLRLSDLASVLARDPSDAVIVPGKPQESQVYTRLVLPADHEDRMPPEGDPLRSEEIALVRRWIEEGAHGSAAGPAESARAGEEPTAPVLQLSASERAARDAALETLRKRGARAQRIASTSDEVEVDLGVAVPPAGAAELALLAGLEPCLVELSLARCTLTDEALAPLARCVRLRRLRLEHTAVGDTGLAPLAQLSALESLDLFDTRVSDGALETLAALPRLARLYVGETRMSASALDELARRRPGLDLERGRLPEEVAPAESAR